LDLDWSCCLFFNGLVWLCYRSGFEVDYWFCLMGWGYSVWLWRLS